MVELWHYLVHGREKGREVLDKGSTIEWMDTDKAPSMYCGYVTVKHYFAKLVLLVGKYNNFDIILLIQSLDKKNHQLIQTCKGGGRGSLFISWPLRLK